MDRIYFVAYNRLSREDLSNEESKLPRNEILKLSKIKDRNEEIKIEFDKIKRDNWILIPRAEEFEEDGIFWDIDSGYSDKRPDFKKMIQLIEENKVKGVFLFELSRLGRDPLVTIPIINYAHEERIILYSTRLRQYEPIYRQMWLMETMQDDGEYNRYKERARREMKYQASKGKRMGSVPRGYKMIDKKPQIIQEEALVVKKVFDLFLNGNSMF